MSTYVYPPFPFSIIEHFPCVLSLPTLTGTQPTRIERHCKNPPPECAALSFPTVSMICVCPPPPQPLFLPIVLGLLKSFYSYR